VTVAVTVHDEEELIRKRLKNLSDLVYPGTADFLIISDGSTDRTESIVQEVADRDSRFRLLRTDRLGKSGAQNAGLATLGSEIAVLSDASCSFAPDYLQKTARYFADPQIGCVTGNLILVQGDGTMATSLGLYWRFEKILRDLESDLGVLATASGSCMAVRLNSFTAIDPIYGDDCVIPLDLALKGKRTVYADDVIAYDTMPDTAEGELRARNRMTLRNITGTLSRRQLLNPIRFPGVACALISHKLLRWLTPLFLIWLLMATLAMAPRGHFYLIVLLGQLVFYMLALAGWLRDRSGKTVWPIASQAYSFLIANLGFLLGLRDAMGRRRITAYR
jgi:cellulose synthase/poly-beta-1,6-N-acetylglucosamine synthase-like glycosyltransferase